MLLDVISVKNMRESDAYTIANYVPSKTLMYRAAMGVFCATEWKGEIGILVGAGNNGGDGYALACILAEQGIKSCVYRVSERFSDDGKYYHDLAREKGVEIREFQEGEHLDSYAILVDCLLGTGFSGEVRGLYRAAIQAINTSPAYVVSVDIGSGLNGDTGAAELAVKANLTVTIGFIKTGLLLEKAASYVGELVVADIGITLLKQEYFLATSAEAIFSGGLSFETQGGELLLSTEAEAMVRPEQGVPDFCMERARENGMLLRVLGKHPLLTDGERLYFIEEGAFPKTFMLTE